MTTGPDLRRTRNPLYAATGTARLLDVPPLRYLMIDGHGDPSRSEYTEAVSALYATAYAIRFTLRDAGHDQRVMPLEGLWWAEDMTTFIRGIRDDWSWTMMIAQPDLLTTRLWEVSRAKVSAKLSPQALARLRLDVLDEGRVAQVLHVGPYATEAPTIAGLHAFIENEGLAPRGHHHEIYLADPRRTAPERLRTILRQPVTGP